MNINFANKFAKVIINRFFFKLETLSYDYEYEFISRNNIIIK